MARHFFKWESQLLQKTGCTIGRSLTGYLRGTCSRPRPGLPLYWFEPGPGWLWRLRTDRDRVFRIVTGFRTLPEGFHLRIAFVPGEGTDLLIGWSLRG